MSPGVLAPPVLNVYSLSAAAAPRPELVAEEAKPEPNASSKGCQHTAK